MSITILFKEAQYFPLFGCLVVKHHTKVMIWNKKSIMDMDNTQNKVILVNKFVKKIVDGQKLYSLISIQAVPIRERKKHQKPIMSCTFL